MYQSLLWDGIKYPTHTKYIPNCILRAGKRQNVYVWSLLWHTPVLSRHENMLKLRVFFDEWPKWFPQKNWHVNEWVPIIAAVAAAAPVTTQYIRTRARHVNPWSSDLCLISLHTHMRGGGGAHICILPFSISFLLHRITCPFQHAHQLKIPTCKMCNYNLKTTTPDFSLLCFEKSCLMR